MRTVFLSLLLLFTTPLYAEWSTWSTETKTLFVASQLAIAADWATTRNAARHNFSNNTYESNIFLGQYPHPDKVDIYMITLLVSNYYITDWIPTNQRGPYLTIRTLGHGLAAMNNIHLGWQMRF